MKKQRTPHLGLKNLRKILNQTQDEFAATIGVSKDAIVSVEIGRNQYSSSLDRKIAMAVGASLGKTVYRFMAGCSWEPLENGMVHACWRAGGRKDPSYTIEDYRVHQKKFDTASLSGAKKVLKEITDELERMVIEAGKSKGKVKNRAPAIIFSLWEWINEATAKFKLTPPKE